MLESEIRKMRGLYWALLDMENNPNERERLASIILAFNVVLEEK
jgi:hypothetical protein